MRETVIEIAVRDFAARRGWLVRKVGWVGRRSAPDRMFARSGRIIFLEFKAPGKQPTLSQRLEIHRMRLAGIEVHVVDNIEDGCAFFA